MGSGPKMLDPKYFEVLYGNSVVEKLRKNHASSKLNLTDQQKYEFSLGYRGAEIRKSVIDGTWSIRHDSSLIMFEAIVRSVESWPELCRRAREWQRKDPYFRYVYRRL
jgi:hypothetical protein